MRAPGSEKELPDLEYTRKTGSERAREREIGARRTGAPGINLPRHLENFPQGLNVIFLHIPAPHTLAFWGRRTGAFATGGSYLDGLDYSDRLLGQMLTVLEAQPRWTATALIVQGDHSWRTGLWRPLAGWSAEDERISNGGRWDPRPVLLIHAPGEQNPATVAAPTSLMIVHEFVAADIQRISQK